MRGGGRAFKGRRCLFCRAVDCFVRVISNVGDRIVSGQCGAGGHGMRLSSVGFYESARVQRDYVCARLDLESEISS
jgi:hypothetical protein